MAAARDGVHVALLRGINVGGRNKLPMRDLAAMFTAAGARDVRTYIQSGNVIFAAPPAQAPRMADAVRAAIARACGFDAPVILRRRSELQAVARRNPFGATGVADAKLLHVAFLADVPAPARVRALDPTRSPPDAFAVRGREVYLHLPNGIARTKLTNAWLDGQLGTVSTLRNWRTTLQLLQLASDG